MENVESNSKTWMCWSQIHCDIIQALKLEVSVTVQEWSKISLKTAAVSNINYHYVSAGQLYKRIVFQLNVHSKLNMIPISKTWTQTETLIESVDLLFYLISGSLWTKLRKCFQGNIHQHQTATRYRNI